MSSVIKTYADLHRFAQEMRMMYGKEFPENVVIRVEVEFQEYRQMIQDFHRAVYDYPSDVSVQESRHNRPSFTVKFGTLKFIVSMEEPTYNFKLC